MIPRNFYTQGGMVHTGLPQLAQQAATVEPPVTAYKLDLPAVPPVVGETVLFCIGPNLFRPLIIATADSLTAKVAGLLILAGDTDRGAPWCRKWMFSPPTKTLPIHYVEGVLWGTQEGQWRRSAAAAGSGTNPFASVTVATVGASAVVDPRMTEESDE